MNHWNWIPFQRDISADNDVEMDGLLNQIEWDTLAGCNFALWSTSERGVINARLEIAAFFVDGWAASIGVSDWIEQGTYLLNDRRPDLELDLAAIDALVDDLAHIRESIVAKMESIDDGAEAGAGDDDKTAK